MAIPKKFARLYGKLRCRQFGAYPPHEPSFTFTLGQVKHAAQILSQGPQPRVKKQTTKRKILCTQ